MTTKARMRVPLICLTAALLLTAPRAAQAQSFLTPFIGFDFGGNAQCADISHCDQKTQSYGLSLGKMGSVFGFEEEFAYGKDFFGSAPGVSSNVFSIMNNLMITPRLHPIRPYFVTGAGLIRTNFEASAGSVVGAALGLGNSTNNFGWDIGGGVILGTKNIGVRGDLRYLHTFNDVEVFGQSLELASEKLNYGRLTLGLYLGF